MEGVILSDDGKFSDEIANHALGNVCFDLKSLDLKQLVWGFACGGFKGRGL